MQCMCLECSDQLLFLRFKLKSTFIVIWHLFMFCVLFNYIWISLQRPKHYKLARNAVICGISIFSEYVVLMYSICPF